jgi:hypothetical protein
MSNELMQNEEARPDMDNLLHEFFEAEMPKPWPAFKSPLQTRVPKQASYWGQYSGRLALAASIALMVAGYLTLGGFFTKPNGLDGVREAGPNVSEHKTLPRTVQPK